MNDLYFMAKKKKGLKGQKLSEQAYIFDKKSVFQWILHKAPSASAVLLLRQLSWYTEGAFTSFSDKLRAPFGLKHFSDRF